MTLDDNDILLAVVKAGDFVEGGRVLHAHPRVLRRRMSSLERDKGIRLFSETPGGWRPTPVALRLALLLQDERYAGRPGSKAAAESIGGRVRVVADDAACARRLAPTLDALTGAYPLIHASLSVIGAADAVDFREADIGLSAVEPTHRNLTVRRVAAINNQMSAGRRLWLTMPNHLSDLPHVRLAWEAIGEALDATADAEPDAMAGQIPCDFNEP